MAITWQLATVAALHDETPRVKTISLGVPGWAMHRPGQHVDIRLTAEDGYQAERSYSIGSAPEAPDVELVIEQREAVQLRRCRGVLFARADRSQRKLANQIQIRVADIGRSSGF